MNKSKIYKNPKDDWYTPKSIIDYVNFVSGGITLDPATTEFNAKRLGIEKFYTKETNGLDKDWGGNVVWLNPPFSNKKDWIEKARQEVDKGNCKVFLLLPMSFETEIYHKYLLGNSILHIPNRRISFIDGATMEQKKDIPFTSIIIEMENNKKSSPFGSVIIEMTKDKKTLIKLLIYHIGGAINEL